MSNSLAKSPLTVTISGKELPLSRVSVLDLIDNFPRILGAIPIRNAKDEIEEWGSVLSPEERKEIITQARKLREEAQDFFDPRMQSLLKTPQGAIAIGIYLITTAAKITKEELYALSTDPNDIIEISNKIQEALALDIDPTTLAKLKAAQITPA